MSDPVTDATAAPLPAVEPPRRRAPRRPLKRMRAAMDASGQAADITAPLADAIVRTPALLDFVSFTSAASLRSCSKALRSLVAQHRWTDAHAAETPIRCPGPWRQCFPAATAVSLDPRVQGRLKPAAILRAVAGVETVIAADRLNKLSLDDLPGLAGVSRLAVELGRNVGGLFDSAATAAAVATALPRLKALDLSSVTAARVRRLDDALMALWAPRLTEMAARGWSVSMTIGGFTAAMATSALRSLSLGSPGRVLFLESGHPLLALSDELLAALPATLEELSLEGFEVDPGRAWTGAPLASLRRLRTLRLADCGLTDGILAHAPPSLRSLDVSFNRGLTGACFAALGGLTKLRLAHVRQKPSRKSRDPPPHVPPGLPLHTGLVTLGSLLELEAPGNGPGVISDEACGGLASLESLDLSECCEPGVSVAGGLLRLPALRRLKLDGWDVPRFDYSNIARLARLQSLSIAGAKSLGTSERLRVPPGLFCLDASSLYGALTPRDRLFAILQARPPAPALPVPALPAPPPPLPSAEEITTAVSGQSSAAVPWSVSEAYKAAVAARAAALAALETARAWIAPRAAGAPAPTPAAMHAVAKACEEAVDAARTAASLVSECAKLVFVRRPAPGSVAGGAAAPPSHDKPPSSLSVLTRRAAACVAAVDREGSKVVALVAAPLQAVQVEPPRHDAMQLTHLTLDGNKACALDAAALAALRRSFPRLESLSLRSCGQDQMWAAHTVTDWAPLLATLRHVDLRQNDVPESVLAAARAACPSVRASRPASAAQLRAASLLKEKRRAQRESLMHPMFYGGGDESFDSFEEDDDFDSDGPGGPLGMQVNWW